MVGTNEQSVLVEGGVAAEAKQALMHLGNVLQAAGSSFENGILLFFLPLKKLAFLIFGILYFFFFNILIRKITNAETALLFK